MHIVNAIAFWILFGIWSNDGFLNMSLKLTLLGLAVLNTLVSIGRI
jgi:hypothetical protein